MKKISPRLWGLAIGLVLLLSACTAKKTASLCSAPSDCPAGQTCTDGACVAIAVLPDLSSSDTTDVVNQETSGTETCQDGPVQCKSDGTGFQVCQNGVLSSVSCAVTPCHPIGDGRFQGREPAACVDGVGCVTTVCEDCGGSFVFDTVSGACLTSCSDDTHCVPGATCSNGQCVIKTLKALGQQCSNNDECGSGQCTRSFVDGSPSSQVKVCCDGACDGDCAACDASGTCRNVSEGLLDSERCTPSDATTCGKTGKCDGQGACALWADGTLCALPSCSNDTQYGSSTCKSGKCDQPTGTACQQGYQCKGAVCDNKACTTHADCADLQPAGAYFCAKNPDDANSGICGLKKDLSDVCKDASFVGSDNDACKSQSCALSRDGQNAICVTSGQCFEGKSTVENGNFYCDGYESATECLSGTWGTPVACTSGVCSVAGRQANSGFRPKLCSPNTGCSGCVACQPGYIANSSGCYTACQSDAQCESEYYCKVEGNSGSCVPKKDDGQSCTDANECRSNQCANALSGGKVCCSEGCANCQRCGDLTGNWICQDLTVPQTDSACPNNEVKEPICGKSRCVSGKCGYTAKGTGCGTTTCANGVLTEYECDGAGACSSKTTSCANGCDGNSCKPNCTKHGDCAATEYCSSSGICKTRRAKDLHCNGSIAVDGKPSSSLCQSGLSCTKDTLTLHDSNGNVTDVAGGYFCRAADTCINAATLNGPSTSYDKNSVICDLAPEKDLQGVVLGVSYFICDGSNWKRPTSMGQNSDTCATNSVTGVYGGCGTEDKDTGFRSGYTEIVCNAGILGTNFSDGGCQQRCKDCGAYMHIKDTAGCQTNCKNKLSYTDNYCDSNYYCCMNSQCGTPGTCLTKKNGHIVGQSTAPCDRSRMCKFRCVDFRQTLGEPNCACQLDSECPKVLPGQTKYVCRCGACTTKTDTNCCTNQCSPSQLCQGEGCFNICSESSCN